MLSNFLTNLFETGRVELSPPDSNSDTDIDVSEATVVLFNAEAVWRQSLPDPLPTLNADVAVWAATKLYRAAQFLVFRDVNPDIIQSTLNRRVPTPATAREHYSADLCLRFLNDVLRLARVAAGNDPLNDHITDLLQDWPLSAALAGAPVLKNSVVWQNDALRLMYLDRLMEVKDQSTQEVDYIAEELQRWAGVTSSFQP